jgi:8-oxo-dGTP diphosphatase
MATDRHGPPPDPAPDGTAPDGAAAFDGTELDVLAWVRVRDGRVLAVRSRGRDAFYLPGGKREPGESDVRALVREVAEELGVRLDPLSVSLVAEIRAPSHGPVARPVVRMRCYEATGRGGAVPGAEIEELAWLSAADRHRLAPAARLLVDRLVEDGRLSPAGPT